MTEARHAADHLVAFARQLLNAAGLADPGAGTVAATLVEADLMGHTTHGLALLPGYLAEIAAGRMQVAGAPEVVADRGGTVVLDGRRLPGPVLVHHAIDLALDRVPHHGTVTVVIRRSHHIACLAAYLERATDRGCVILLMSSDPNVASVAPFGGIRPLITPNPIAAGIPTPGEPILMDISTSTTTNGLTNRCHAEGGRLAAPWVLDAHGAPTDDPAALFTDPPGTILPLGGLDSGHKGFALGLLVEALTAGLGGFGRADPREGWGAAVYLQIIDPGAFGGTHAFLRQTGWLADQALATPAAPGAPPVRLPGDRARARRAEQRRDGVALYPGLFAALQPWAARLGVPVPAPVMDA